MILHPLFIIITFILIIYSFLEVYNYKNYKSVWLVVIIMIVLVGFRGWVGADYGAYVQMYDYFGEKLDYEPIISKALGGDEKLDVEWFYTLLGKWAYSAYLPFFGFTFIIAIISMVLKYITFENSVIYPSLSLLLYIYPSYFSADGGHMRQAIAMAIIIFSFVFIKKRKLFLFLFMIYLAMGFHKSAFIFIFAYWLAIYPLNAIKIILLVSLSMVLSPFRVYEYISLLDSIAPAEVYEGFQAYEMIEDSNTGTVKFTDLICIMYTYFLVTYDRDACEQIPYYEYMRNIGVIGICMYFIFRGSPIFSSRLSAYYMIFMVMVLPNILASVKNIKLKKGIHLFLVIYVLFYSYVYSSMQGYRAGYNWDRYHNVLW